MRFLAATLLLLCSAANAATFTLDLKWLHSYGLPEVRDNACYVAVPDWDEEMLTLMGRQVAWCINTGKVLVSDNPPEGSRRFVWIETSHAEMLEAYERLLKECGSLPVDVALPPRMRAFVHGFAELNLPVPHIHTDGYAPLGHEVLHIFEGQYHGEPFIDAAGVVHAGRWHRH